MLSTHRYLIDENLPSKLAKRFNDAGYSATSVALCGLAGQGDHSIFRYACTHKLVIITADSDFLKTANFPPPHAGIVVLQFPHRTRIADIIAALMAVLPQIATLNLADQTYVLEQGTIRVHQ
jgi:predicted nuclease of predicted toxin-antitoxin system